MAPSKKVSKIPKKKSTVKAPVNAYAMFVKNRMVDGTVEGSGVEKFRQVAKQWKDCSDEEREEYVKMAAVDRERYSKEMAEAKGDAEDKLKRPLSSYLLYAKDYFIQHKGQFGSAKDMVRAAAKSWNELPEDEKNDWREQGKGETEKYNQMRQEAIDSGKLTVKRPRDKSTRASAKSKDEPPAKKHRQASSSRPSTNKPAAASEKKKRPKSGYLVYVSQYMKDHKGQFASAPEMMKAAAGSWKSLSEDERNNWVKKAGKDNLKSGTVRAKPTPKSSGAGKTKKPARSAANSGSRSRSSASGKSRSRSSTSGRSRSRSATSGRSRSRSAKIANSGRSRSGKKSPAGKSRSTATKKTGGKKATKKPAGKKPAAASRPRGRPRKQ